MSQDSKPDSDVEIHRPAYPAQSDPYPYISYNLPFHRTISKHLSASSPSSPFAGKSKVYIIASAGLSKNTKYTQTLLDELGEKVVGVRYGMRPHTLWSEILEVTNDAREKKADVLVTVGAGSLTDGAKIIALALANNASTFSDLEELHSGKDWSKKRPELNEPNVPVISVPTSLSGGEYSFLGGGTHDTSQQKFGFGHPTKGPVLVILDANLTTTTPSHIWLQSGVRAVDHCIEGLCSLSEKCSVESDESAMGGLKLLVKGLLKCKANPKDLEARHECQMGVIEAMGVVFQFGVPMGASHGIGHQLGPMGVGHGETSCVLLPAVCQFNSTVNGRRQEKAKEIFWADEEARKVFEGKGLREEEADLGKLLDCFISALGMPRSLKAVGVEGEEKMEMLAANALTDHWCETNPRPLRTKEDVMTILDVVKG